MENKWQHFDAQTEPYKIEILSTISYGLEMHNGLATSISHELTENIEAIIIVLHEYSNTSIKDLFDESFSLHNFTRITSTESNAYLSRARLIYEFYMCFVYLTDNIFELVARQIPRKSVSRKIINFLKSGEARDFRNAFSHGTWRYVFEDDFEGVEYWSKKEVGNNKVVRRIDNSEYNLWSMMARCLIYVLSQEIQDELKRTKK